MTISRTTLLVVYRAGSDVLAKGAMFAVTIVAVRRLPPQAFGMFAIATTLGWLVTVAGDFGIQVHLARTVALRPHRAADALRRWLPLRFAFGVVALIGSYGYLRLSGTDAAASSAVLVIVVAYAAAGMTECLYYLFRGLGRSDIESTLTVAHRTGMAALALLVLWRAPTLELLAWALLVPAAATLVVAVVAGARVAGGETPGASRHAPAARQPEFVTQVLPVGLGLLLSALYFRIDVFLVERWSGTAAVAVYGAVFRLIDALRLFPAAVLAVMLPALCQARNMDLMMRLGAHLTTAAAGAAAVLWLSAGFLIPALFGDSYVSGVTPFRILLLSLPLMGLNYVLTQQLVAWHRHNAYAAVCAAALACNLAVNWMLIPSFGPAGAAWATVATEVVVALGCAAAFARRRATIAPAAGDLDMPAAPVSLEIGG